MNKPKFIEITRFCANKRNLNKQQIFKKKILHIAEKFVLNKYKKILHQKFNFEFYLHFTNCEEMTTHLLFLSIFECR